jgi:hypothetical protein
MSKNLQWEVRPGAVPIRRCNLNPASRLTCFMSPGSRANYARFSADLRELADRPRSEPRNESGSLIVRALRGYKNCAGRFSEEIECNSDLIFKPHLLSKSLIKLHSF